jgi:hypothetical protein
MAQIALECPHCRAEKIGFAPRGAVQVMPGGPHSLIFLQCQGCGQAIIAVVQNNTTSIQYWMLEQAASPGPIITTYPKPESLQSPPDVPAPVRAAYLSGLDNLGRKGGANAAAIMFRRAIEVATKAVNPTASKGDNLKKRIESLPSDIATPAMKEWAQHIRLDANDAAHEEVEYSAEDAKRLHIFAEMFLTYAFTLPAMLKKAKETGSPVSSPQSN